MYKENNFICIVVVLDHDVLYGFSHTRICLCIIFDVKMTEKARALVINTHVYNLTFLTKQSYTHAHTLSGL